MDIPSSLRKSFKNSTKISAGRGESSSTEEQPILSHHRRDGKMEAIAADVNGRGEVIVKIDGGGDGHDCKKVWPETSYNFWRQRERGGGFEKDGGSDGSFHFQHPSPGDDPPSRLIENFLDKQRAAGGEMSLDMDLEMDELRHDHYYNRKSPPQAESPLYKTNNKENNDDNRTPRISTSRDVKVSFQDPSPVVDNINEKRYDTSSSSEEDDQVTEILSQQHRSPSFSPMIENGGGEVLRCTSFQRRQSMLRTKTKSRLVDPPELDIRSGRTARSGQFRSGILGRTSGMLSKAPDDDEDDLFDEDIPEEYKKANLNALTILEWFSLVVIVAFLISSLAIPSWKTKTFRGLQWWKWMVLILVLICGRLVSGWAIRIVVFFIERNFFLRKRVLYFVYGVKKPVQNCIWLGLVLIAWHCLFDKKVDKEQNNKFLRYVNKILLCFLVGTLLWLVKTLVVKVLASSFHVSTFFDRIQESLFNQYVIESLSGPPIMEVQSCLEEEERTMAEVQKLQNAGATLPPDLGATAFYSGKRVRGSGVLQRPRRSASQKLSGLLSNKKKEEGIPIDQVHKLNPKNISAWNMKRLIRTVRLGVLSTLDEQVIESNDGDDSAKEIRSECEAKVAARKIFQNVARRGSKYIFLQDVLRFLPGHEALKTMTLLGGSPDTERITKSALKNWVVNAFRERRALALTLNDTKTAVNKLHQMVNVLVGIIILIACLLLLEIATSKFLVLMSSQIVLVAFIFGNTCKTIFEAIIFLFVIHPFDVGDRCEVDGVQMIVEEMNILTTVFLRYDNLKIVYANSSLALRPIGNFYRSPDMGDSIEFSIHIATPAEKIGIMKQRITSFIESKKDHWYPSPAVMLMDFQELNRLKLSVWLRHRINFQDMGEKFTRRALVMEEMMKIFKELDIEYRLHPVDINVRAMPPINFTRMPSTWTTSS